MHGTGSMIMVVPKRTANGASMWGRATGARQQSWKKSGHWHCSQNGRTAGKWPGSRAHPFSKKSEECMILTRLRAPPGHGGKEGFWASGITDPLRGRRRFSIRHRRTMSGYCRSSYTGL